MRYLDPGLAPGSFFVAATASMECVVVAIVVLAAFVNEWSARHAAAIDTHTAPS